MPALNPVSKVVRFDLFQTVGADTTARDRFFMTYSGTLSTPDLTTLVATFVTAWTTNMRALFTTDKALNTVVATDLTSASSPQVTNNANVAGTRTGTSLSAGSCMVVKHRILRRYRGGHPRMYFAVGNTADYSTAQTWSAAFQTSVQAGWAATITTLGTAPPAAVGTFSQVSVSYFTGSHVVTNPFGRARNVPNPRSSPLVDSVTAISVNPKFGSQRRRNLQTP